MKKLLSFLLVLCSLQLFGQTIAVDVQKHWDAGNRVTPYNLNFNPAGLCPLNRGQIIDFMGEKWVDLTCSYDDTPIFGNHRSQFAYNKNTSNLIYDNNRFYYFECYLKDWALDNKNLLIFQVKYGSNYPQMAIWVTNISGALKFWLVRQTSTIPDQTTFEDQNTHVLGNITSNAKLKFFIEVDWQTDNTGSIYIEINGTPVVNLTGIQTLDAQADPTKPKYGNVLPGPYCFSWPDPGTRPTVDIREFYIRKLLIGNSDFNRAGFKALLEEPTPPPVGTNESNSIIGTVFING